MLGLGVFGLSSFAFLGIAGRDLGPAGSAPLSVAWTVLNAVGIGLFLPLEQEAGRRLSGAIAVDGGASVSMRGTLRYAVWAVAVLAVVGAALHVPLSELILGGERVLVAVLVLALAAQAAEYLARGVLAGTGQFGRYGSQLAVDGALRVAGAALVAASGNGSVLAYGAVLVAAPALATVVTLGARARRTGVA
ncbi:polysaccharide biosynthesis protein, partial [Actinotalea ferrariae]|uniref:hypothetical protein n=1 Tax=Actinotalea ferrariae TaxID=1386098 RepID=UPI001C8BDC2A